MKHFNIISTDVNVSQLETLFFSTMAIAKSFTTVDTVLVNNYRGKYKMKQVLNIFQRLVYVL